MVDNFVHPFKLFKCQLVSTTRECVDVSYIIFIEYDCTQRLDSSCCYENYKFLFTILCVLLLQNRIFLTSDLRAEKYLKR